MASIKKFRDKWYARIQTWDHGARKEKLIPLKTRFQGKDASGHQDIFQRLQDPDNPRSDMTWSQNYLNFDVDSFNVTEKGSLEDIVRAETNRFSVLDSNSNDDSGTL